MSITYLGDTTEFEEGKTYTLRWSVPDFAGQKLWIHNPPSNYSNIASKGDDYSIESTNGYGVG